MSGMSGIFNELRAFIDNLEHTTSGKVARAADQSHRFAEANISLRRSLKLSTAVNGVLLVGFLFLAIRVLIGG